VSIRVLVVDDSATVRHRLCADLNQRGIETDTARNGQEAQDKLEADHGFDVVITDLKMPGIVDGERLIDTLKKNPAMESLPVIVVTAFNEREVQLANLKHGAVAVFGKPWDPDLLAVTVTNCATWKTREQRFAGESRTDALTGLGNRRYGLERLNEEIALCNRHRRLLSVAILDIDHFKRVNDTHGHSGGDDVLRHVAQLLRSASRSSDVLARWGGEEFLFVFPDTDLADAAQIVERFRGRLAAQPVELPSEKAEVAVTISGGAAEYQSGDTPDSLVSRADQALYRAKEEGRNRLMASQAGQIFAVTAT